MCRTLCALCFIMLVGSAAPALEPPYAADVNNDGRVNVLDLIRLRNALSASPDSSQAFWHDVNRDGRLDILDLIMARNYLGTRLPQRRFVFDFGPAGSPVAPGAIGVSESLAYDPQIRYG